MASSSSRSAFAASSSSTATSTQPLQPVSRSVLNSAANFVPTVCEAVVIQITQVEHNTLIELARRYTNLRTNLIALGADVDLIEQYSNEDSTPTSADLFEKALDAPSQEPTFDNQHQRREVKCAVSKATFTAKPASATYKPMSAKANDFYPSELQNRVSTWMNKRDDDEQTNSAEHNESPVSHTPSNTDVVEERPRLVIARNARRSLRLDNLGIGTLLSDITAAVRGGQILEIYQRYKEKAAIVSFVHEHEAQAFYNHVRKHDLYIRSKRVEVSWNDFQKSVPGNIAWQIRGGATRNFIVRQCDSFQTPEGIQSDLEHIHDLRVASVEFRGRDCYIKTNSVLGAYYARTCMSSRHRYKRCRFDWDVDECTEPHEDVIVQHVVPSPPSRLARPLNRYEMLSADRDA